MTWGAVAGAVIGGVAAASAAGEQADAAGAAAGTSAAASRYAADIQKQMYDQSRKDYTPWRNVGAGAVNKLGYLMGIEPQIDFSMDDIKKRLEPLFTSDQPNNPLSDAIRTLYAQHASGMEYDAITGTQSAGSGTSPITGDPNAMSWDEYQRQLAALQGTVTEKVIDNVGLNAATQAEYDRLVAAEKAKYNQADFGKLTRNFGLSDFEKEPGYEFRLSEGLKALDRSAAARGGLQSGSALKAAGRFGQDYASNEYQNAYNRYQANQSNLYNRLAGLSGTGQTATNALTTAGTQAAGNMGNYAMTGGANVAGAQLAAGNANASSYSGLAKALGGINLNSLLSTGGTSAVMSPGGSVYDTEFYG